MVVREQCPSIPVQQGRRVTPPLHRYGDCDSLRHTDAPPSTSLPAIAKHLYEQELKLKLLYMLLCTFVCLLIQGDHSTAPQVVTTTA